MFVSIIYHNTYLLVDKFLYLCTVKETKLDIIRIANELIRTKGYNAFSYADIAERLKIKTASIHYHFPSKSNLGVAVIKETITDFENFVHSISSLDILNQYIYFIKMHDTTQKSHWVCLMGALSASVDTLSDEMKLELRKMASTIIDYLTDLLTKGKEKGVFSFSDEPETKAYLIQSSVVASLLLDKVMDNNVYKIIQNGLLKI